MKGRTLDRLIFLMATGWLVLAPIPGQAGPLGRGESFSADGDKVDTIPRIQRIDPRADLLSGALPLRLEFGGSVLDYPRQGPYFLNLFEMIRGQLPGLWVSGNYLNYRIRVRAAMHPPLIVLDGIPFYGYDDQQINDLLLNIPPADVARIVLLKNLANTALYGPGSGNGVILIFTRRGER